MFKIYILFLQCMTIMTGLICLWRKGPVLLWLILITKILAGINENIIADNAMRWWGISRSVFYNLFVFVDVSAWCAIHFILLRRFAYLKPMVVCSWLALMLIQLAEIYFTGIRQLNVNSLILFCAVSILFSLIYFTRVLKDDEYDLKHDPGFWLCCAAVIFHPILLVNLLSFADPHYRADAFAAHTFDILQFIGTGFYNLFICISFYSFYKYRRNYKVVL